MTTIVVPTRYTSDPEVLLDVAERQIVTNLWDTYFSQILEALLADPSVSDQVKSREKAYAEVRPLRPNRYLTDPGVLNNQEESVQVQSQWTEYFRQMNAVEERFPGPTGLIWHPVASSIQTTATLTAAATGAGAETTIMTEETPVIP